MRRAGPAAAVALMLLAASVPGAYLSGTERTPSSSGGPASPKDPSSPLAELRDRKDIKNEAKLPATIITARGGKKTGWLEIPSASIEVTAAEGAALRKMSVAFADIDSIEITRWRGVERRKNEFAFYPSEMKITLRDKKSLLCPGNVPVLNRISFGDSGGRHVVFTFFYDYWKQDRWKNCGQADRNYPEANPPEDILVKIIFIREEMKNPLEKLLSR